MEANDPVGELAAREDFRKAIEDLRSQLDAATSLVQSQIPGPEEITSLAGIGLELDRLSRAYLDQLGIIAERKRQLLEEEEAQRKRRAEDTERRRTPMPEKREAPARDEAEIQRLSEELSTGLRLDRVDNAIKELLAFLADTEFFEANASVGRKRRLRTLQNTIEKALAK